MFKTRTMLFAGALAAGLTAGAMASDNTVNEQLKALRAELDAVRASNTQLQGQVAQLRSASDENWLNERRTEEVKSLVKEVLADADTRASLLEGGMTAGHNGKEFFLASEDGSFKLSIGGQLQFRSIWNFSDNNSSEQDDQGFQFRRIKLKFKGHIGDPKLTFGVTLATDRAEGLVELEEAFFGYKLGGGWSIEAGKLKIPFLRQELVSSSAQLAVDRGLVTEFFTLDYSEQVQLKYANENLKLTFSLNDGADEEFSTIGADPVEIALSARADLKLAGDWGQWKDTSTWSKDKFGAFLGAAVFYQAGDSHNANNSSNSKANYTAWTVDGSIESNGLGLFAAVMGANVDWDSSSTASTSPLGFLVEAGYMVIPDKLEPFVRWEYLDYDSASLQELQALTVGFNYYFKKHNAKLTSDVVWVYDGNLSSNAFGNSPSSDGLGFSGDFSSAVDNDIFVWRTQFQLLF